jgi:hypothetical protein
MALIARLAITAREVAGPQASPGVVQSESFLHTICVMRHIRMGPGVPLLLGTQVSVLLTGRRQGLAGGITQVFTGVLQVFVTAVQVLSVLFTQASCGRLQMFAVPLQVCAVRTQLCD